MDAHDTGGGTFVCACSDSVDRLRASTSELSFELGGHILGRSLIFHTSMAREMPAFSV